MRNDPEMSDDEVFEAFPYPFANAGGQKLWDEMSRICDDTTLAVEIADKYASIDRLDLQPNLTVRQLWHALLEKAAIKHTTRELVLKTRELTSK